MTDFASILHDSPAAVEGRPVIVPGEIELNKMRQQRAEGIKLDAATVTVLHQHAASAK
jgi:LDH2 family malate/lactate/ureidoglycolate dehydrogenase